MTEQKISCMKCGKPLGTIQVNDDDDRIIDYICHNGCKPESPSELDRWAAIHEDARTIQEFLSFLNDEHINLCKLYEDREFFMPILERHDDIVYRYFNINPNKLDNERKELLKSLQVKQ